MPTQIKVKLDNVYRDSAPPFAIMKRWTIEYKHGYTTLFDNECSGRLILVTSTINMEKIHQMVRGDQ